MEFKITEPDREAECIVQLAERMRVTCLTGERFLVAESALAVLDQIGIHYTVLARQPFNDERMESFAGAVPAITVTQPASS